MPASTAPPPRAAGPGRTRLARRAWPALVSPFYVLTGLLYFFRWGSVVRHVPSQWIAPGDLLNTYTAASALAHGHVGDIYRPESFLAYPGILVVLAPLGALSGVFRGSFVQIGANHHLLAHPRVFFTQHVPSTLAYLGPSTSKGNEYVIHPQFFVALAPVALALSCVALFAGDALAERLGVVPWRRAVLAVAEGVVLWNVTVLWGHPEDAVALALAAYAVLLAFDERFGGAGWLFGAAVAVQPLVLGLFPVLLVMGGARRVLGLAVRLAVPVVAVTLPPLVANLHDTVHTLITQPTYPDDPSDHQTAWTFLSPKLSGTGVRTELGGGPVRIVVLAASAAAAWWARRWRGRPEMLLWLLAVVLSLRLALETVMTDYYLWPALALALVVAARCSQRRFVIAVVLAVLTTVVAQWELAWLPWWLLDLAGVAALLVVTARPEPVPASGAAASVPPARVPAGAARPRSGATKDAAKKKRRKASRTDRKRSVRR